MFWPEPSEAPPRPVKVLMEGSCCCGWSSQVCWTSQHSGRDWDGGETYLREGTATAGGRLHPGGRVDGGQAVVLAEGVRIPALGAAQLVAAVAGVDGRVQAVVVAGCVVAGLGVLGRVQALVELAVGVKLARGLAVQRLRLMALRARRAGRRVVVVHVVRVVAHSSGVVRLSSGEKNELGGRVVVPASSEQTQRAAWCIRGNGASTARIVAWRAARLQRRNLRVAARVRVLQRREEREGCGEGRAASVQRFGRAALAAEARQALARRYGAG